MAFLRLKNSIFRRKIGSSLWKVVRLTQKSACMILVGIRKKFTREILIFRFLPILRQPKSQKTVFFSDSAAEPPQKIAKNQNFKNSRVSFVELYIRINHVKFYIDWIIFQRLNPKLVMKKNLEITAF